ncbi:MULTISPECIES: DUF1269 domain-containing protein [Oxalobacteraceae]|jgi:uncharacterized membrane protein YeaQ/YmgE (transglycosylase-associated protein family)|uniref:DUF1269 domain-containing protein n=1 Tax=Oxalobacteraceae TaxID=75682 RepID=UPI001455F454|nr:MULTISPECIES: DUF1269 domain-containing protein [Oxalobacteraceae]
MRRRIYFMLPDVPSARALLDELLLARIEERYMHFCAKDGTPLPDMPEANFLQKTDLVHGAESGMLVGGAIGLIGGALLVLFPPEGVRLQMIAVLVAGIVGALFGAWASGMVAAAIPNSRLKAFQAGMERGQVLLMIDVPNQRVTEIENLVEKRHPEARFGGMEPHIPAFP